MPGTSVVQGYVACLLAGLHAQTFFCAVGPAAPASGAHARRRRLLRAHSPSACARSGNGPLHQLHGQGISICDSMPAQHTHRHAKPPVG